MTRLTRRQEELLADVWQVELASLTRIRIQSIGLYSTTIDPLVNRNKAKLKTTINTDLLCGKIQQEFMKAGIMQVIKTLYGTENIHLTQLVFIGFLLNLQSFKKSHKDTLKKDGSIQETTTTLTTENVIVCSFNTHAGIFDKRRSESIDNFLNRSNSDSDVTSFFVEENPNPHNFLYEMIKTTVKLIIVYNEHDRAINPNSITDIQKFVSQAAKQCREQLINILVVPFTHPMPIFDKNEDLLEQLDEFRKQILARLKKSEMFDTEKTTDARNQANSASSFAPLEAEVCSWFKSYIIVRFFGERIGTCLAVNNPKRTLESLRNQSQDVFKANADDKYDHDIVIFNMLKTIYSTNRATILPQATLRMYQIFDNDSIDTRQLYEFLYSLYTLQGGKVEPLKDGAYTKELLNLPARVSSHNSIHAILKQVNQEYRQIAINVHPRTVAKSTSQHPWQQSEAQLNLKEWLASDKTNYRLQNENDGMHVVFSESKDRIIHVPGYLRIHMVPAQQKQKLFSMSNHALMIQYKLYCSRLEIYNEKIDSSPQEYAKMVFDRLKVEVERYLGVKIEHDASQLPGNVAHILQNLQDVSMFGNALSSLAKLLSGNYDNMIHRGSVSLLAHGSWEAQFSFFWQVLSCTVLRSDNFGSLTEGSGYQINITNTLHFKDTACLVKSDYKMVIIPYRCFLAVADIFDDISLHNHLITSRSVQYNLFLLRLYMEQKMRLPIFFNKDISAKFKWTGFGSNDVIEKNKVDHLLSLILSLSKVSTSEGFKMDKAFDPPITSISEIRTELESESFYDSLIRIIDDVQERNGGGSIAKRMETEGTKMVKYNAASTWSLPALPKLNLTNPTFENFKPFIASAMLVLPSIYALGSFDPGFGLGEFLSLIMKLAQEVQSHPQGNGTGSAGPSTNMEVNVSRKTMTGNKINCKKREHQHHAA